MGGAVSSVAKAVTSPANIIGSAVNQIPVIGPIAGPITSAVLAPPGFGLAAGLSSAAFNAATGAYSGGGGGGGGGGSPTYGTTDASGNIVAPPAGFNYGANTYTYDNQPYDASKYFVQGNKGVYNVLPELGNLYSPETQAQQGTSSFNAYQNIYGKMAGDPLAQANLQRTFAPGMLSVSPQQAGGYKPIGDFNPATSPYAGGRADLPGYLAEDIKSAYGEYMPQAQSSGASYLPIQYADFGFGSEDQAYKLAQYAAQNKNPFFQPFATPTEEAAPEMANPFAFVKPPEAPPAPPSPYQPVEGGPRRGPAERSMVPATTATMGTFRPVEASNVASNNVAEVRRPEEYKPVNIRTGGLATLRRK
jgi:hypothetical protein